jgi:hypothetical protein
MGVLVEPLPMDVREYCDQHGLMPALRESAWLVQKYFPEARHISAELVHDPDAGAEWVALNVEVAMPVPVMLERDAAFLAEWSTWVGRHVLDRLVVMVYPADDGWS